ncbi:reverse transcriptase (RNA-dependent DNA polymerase) [Leucobacter komagatae]|uniref:Reverse transcriptase (RNA-dependent DNA polymerase) n=1 Tax=Leucobacter komagatae TaxID=55969 RepID=A0A542Y257_9MICO|nr:RNA-directed DNA polymerase [Leucobacter komagatae]TQL42161.1 reverse transcriptase (RNA-dependent DNA polymerase) [Leucobacter komagatae]
MEFTLDDLSLAFRKAKADLFYSSNSRPFELLEYEEDLLSRLRDLRDKLNGDDELWVTERKFVGGYFVVPAGFQWGGDSHTMQSGVVRSSPYEEWRARAADKSAVGAATFRLMNACSIDMHVLSALWVGHVGALFDEKLERSVRGNRLRRTESGAYNWYSIGSTVPYLMPYSSWKSDGFDAIEEGLASGQAMTAFTADVTAFFHRIDPQFLGSEKFQRDVLGVKLEPREDKLNRLLLSALSAWAAHQTRRIGEEVRGLPVGLSASGVVANLALTELDRLIEEEVKPRYYGRYVDDIILVLDGKGHFNSVEEAWRWLAQRTARSQRPATLGCDDRGGAFASDYLTGSEFRFDSEKNRLFLLDPDTAESMLRGMRHVIEERSSEWRMMPVLPEGSDDISQVFARASQLNGDPAGSLGEVTSVATSRSAFALVLRDFEAFSRDLPPQEWQAQRSKFFKMVREHIFTPSRLLEMDQYVQRVLSLAVVCGDRGSLSALVRRMVGVFLEITEGGYALEAKGMAPQRVPLFEKKLKGMWARHIREQVWRAVYLSGPPVEEVLQELAEILASLPATRPSAETLGSLRLVEYERLQARDLAMRPARLRWFPRSMSLPSERADAAPRRTQAGTAVLERKTVPRKLRRPLAELASVLHLAGDEPEITASEFLARNPALAFPTRPLDVGEMLAISRFLSKTEFGNDENEEELGKVADWVFATRGFTFDPDLGEGMRVIDERGRKTVSLRNTAPFGSSKPVPEGASSAERKRVLALSMYETSEDSVIAALHGAPMLTGDRYRSLARIVNATLELEDKADYLILGELAIPSQWFFPAARKLMGVGTSLIAGVDYLVDDEKRTVRNQMWCALVNTEFGFRTLATFSQDKQIPAHSERRNLAAQNGYRLEPENQWRFPPLVSHDGFYFSMVICSELTNIEYRASLRGDIDMLIVPEWNQDLHTFEPLVESAALDIHAYIAQVNNRLHGDTRVRVPAGSEWKRDVLRLRGGMHDYVVAVEIDWRSLRAFQTQESSSSKAYKPLPDGFTLAARRGTVPRKRDV